jgi:hypothetical protein
MNSYIRSGIDRREMTRRHSDLDAFEQCPKYNKHELTDEQIDKIAKQAAEQAMKLMEDKKDIQFAQFVKKVGFSWGEKVVFILGLLVIWVVAWATNNGFKL